MALMRVIDSPSNSVHCDREMCTTTPTRACRGLIRAAVFLLGVLLVWAEGTIICHLEPAKPLSRFSPDQLELLEKLIHADSVHLARLTRIIVPDRWNMDELLYSPMPHVVPHLSQERKAIFVDLAAQVFGAYEYGRLVRWGPVSSGDRSHQTPAGAYRLNWQARVHVSTENATWVMPWYFNFANNQGLALHQYALPGRPASHGCVRLLAVDAKWLFNWGESWTLAAGTRELVQPGTPVLLFGKYDYGARQPWLEPGWWAQGVSVPAQQIATRR